MGSKYEFKVNDVPPPGFYSPSESMLKSRSQSAIITKPQLVEDNRHGYLKRETGPDTIYEKHDEFGSKLGPVTMGGKYKTTYDSNPGVGQYDVAQAEKSVMHNSKSTKIMKDQMDRTQFTDKRYSNDSPSNLGPGQYDNSFLSSFNKKPSNAFTIGLKRDSKIDRSPGPGDFDANTSLNVTKPAIRGGPYISDKNDFEEKNAWQYQSQTSNPYVQKPRTPTTAGKSYMAPTLSKARKELGDSSAIESKYRNSYL